MIKPDGNTEERSLLLCTAMSIAAIEESVLDFFDEGRFAGDGRPMAPGASGAWWWLVPRVPKGGPV